MARQIAKMKLESKANIRTITDVYSRLYTNLRDSDEVELDVGDCAEADLSLVQLIESARVYARTAGKTFRLSGPVGPEIGRVLTRGGFLEKADDEDRRFWFNEGVE